MENRKEMGSFVNCRVLYLGDALPRLLLVILSTTL